MNLAYPLSLGAAFLLAIGFVLQQHVASDAPGPLRLSPLLLVGLARRPLWLAGIGAMVGGQLLGAAALSQGSLTLVEPLLAANLLFALPLAAAWRRSRLGLREYGGAALLLAGLAGFIAATGPAQSRVAAAPATGWITAGLTIAAVVGVVTAVAKRSSLSGEATLLAAAAGVLYGLQDALTQATVTDLGAGVGGLLATWHPYALLVVAITGLALGQNAFKAAPLPASLPAITIAEPVCGVAIGAGLLDEQVRLGWPFGGLEVATLVLMVVGVVLVARSPVVCGDEHHAHRG